LIPRVGFYHAGLPTDERERIQAAYGRGELRVLCATNAFGMGIDHPDVRLVIHWAIPGTLEALYQEMGRAGRDGDESTCLVLLSRRDMVLQRWFIEQGDAPSDLRRRRKKALDTLIQFAEGGDCRHAGILTYFRDSRRLESCGHCDACDPDSSRRIRLDDVPAPRRRSKAPRDRRLTVDTKQALDGADLERFAAIKDWRRNVARDVGMPAFMVMSDKTLRAIAVHNPSTLDELARIQGMGEKRLDQFGAALIRVLGEVG
jgi:ATP-dependent DNA helicase RecQ